MIRRSRRISNVVLAAAAVALTACDLFTNPDPPSGTVEGTVNIDAAPAANIEVTIARADEAPIVVRTNANGKFAAEVPTGVVNVQVTGATNLNCLNGLVTLEVREGQTSSVAFACLDVTPFTLSAAGGFDHNTGVAGESVECKRITTTPARPGGTYSMTVEGPIDRTPPGGGVVAGQTFAGTLDANGTALVRVRITRLGTYRNTMTATSKGGVARGLTVDVNVTTGASPIPCQ